MNSVVIYLTENRTHEEKEICGYVSNPMNKVFSLIVHSVSVVDCLIIVITKMHKREVLVAPYYVVHRSVTGSINMVFIFFRK